MDFRLHTKIVGGGRSLKNAFVKVHSPRGDLAGGFAQALRTSRNMLQPDPPE